MENLCNHKWQIVHPPAYYHCVISKGESNKTHESYVLLLLKYQKGANVWNSLNRLKSKPIRDLAENVNVFEQLMVIPDAAMRNSV